MRAALQTVAVVGMTGLALLWSNPTPADPATVSTIRYVALGDSRAAGPYLAPEAVPDDCFRSTEGYPEIVAQSLHPISFTNVSCPGARTENLTDTPQTTPNGLVPPQIDRLPPDTTVVTVSIGGNDIAWPRLVAPCYTPVPGADAHCRSDPDTADRMDAALTALGPRVASALSTITRKAPDARVPLVGHGGIVGAHGCWPNLPISDADAAWVTVFFARINRVLAAAAAGAGAEFVDIAATAVGHDACAGPGQRWFEGLMSQSLAQPLHPNAAGMQAIAARVVAAWNASVVRHD